MADGSVFPLEFFVGATPRSQGASAASKERWKEQLQKAAREKIAETVDIHWLDDRPVALSIYYFPSAPMDGDVDNIIKPIMDALRGVSYPDDKVVERVLAQKLEPDAGWSFSQPSDTLSQALDTRPPVVYIRIDDGLAWRQN